ncbi:MAG TPA: hypothetical protein VNY83_04490 [Solirubrobacterales bacterium]|nr:hypothetical protein [Solirubrobacterales bacterium]
MDALIESRAVEARRSRRGCSRDLELLRYVGRHGVVRIDQVMTAMSAGRTVTYDRVATCVDAGLLERLELVRSEPGILRATRDGLRYAGLGLPLAVVSAGQVDHWLRCASTALLLGKHYGHNRVLTERELILAEQIEGKPIASATVGEHRSGKPRLHRPDLAVLTDEGTIAIEVELMPKAPRRLYGLMRSWRRTIGMGVVSEVHYHCEPGQTRRAVERAVEQVRAEQFIAIGQAVAR